MKKKIFKKLLVTLMVSSVLMSETGMTALAAEMEDAGQVLDITADEAEVDGTEQDNSDQDVTFEEEEAEQDVSVEFQESEEDAVPAGSEETDLFSDGMLATDENVSDSVGTASNDYTQWKQWDPEWNQAQAWPKSQYPNATAYYMKDAGCLVTSIAMLLRHYNVVTGDVNSFNPWICNETLKNAGAFNSAADMYFNLGNAYPGMSYQGVAAYSFAKVKELYDQGYACVIQVLNYHYVAVKNVSGSTVEIMDPGYSNRPTIASYVNPLRIYYYKVSGTGQKLSISNIRFSDVTADSYVISCTITGNVTRVYFPTWPSADDSGNPIWHEGTINGNTASCVIRKSDHGNRVGTYISHIYIYDAAGHEASAAAPEFILGDTIRPTISDVKIVNITEDSYTVTCKVADNVKVTSAYFPTWPSADDSGNPIWHEGVINGDTASCVIRKSDHGNRTGTYITHIYIYDASGNEASYAAPAIEMGKAHLPPEISNIKVSDISKDGYTITCTVVDDAGVDRVQFPTWTTNNGQDDLDALNVKYGEWQTAAYAGGTISGSTVTYRVKTSDHNGELGEYCTNIYAYDIYGNYASVEVPKVMISDKIDASLTANPSGSAVKGSQVKLTASASGGSGSFVYKFWISDESNENWYLLRDYGKSSTYTWTTGAVGKKHLYVDVKDSYGTVKRAGITFEVKNKTLTASLSASPSGSAVSGSQVKLTAGAGGGNGNYTYKFLICDAKGNWYKLRDYAKSNTYTWTTGTVGKKTLYVDVKDSNGTVKRAGITFEVKNKALTASLSASPSGSTVSGSQVKLTAGASGGSGNYTYKFLVCDAKGNWYKLRDYGKSNTYTWTTGAAGKKTLYVDVKDSNGTVKRAALSYEVKSKTALSVTLSASPSGSAASGSNVVLIAKATGGNGKYTYKFLICDAKGNWYRLQDYGTDNAYIWIPGATGKKTLYVDVKDSTGQYVRRQISFTVTEKAKGMALESEEAAVVGEIVDVFTDGEERATVQTEELPSTEDTVF